MNEQLRQRILNDFTYHKPNKDNLPRYQRLREEALELALFIGEVVPPGREQSLALTNLQQTIMWANAGIACNEAPEEERESE